MLSVPHEVVGAFCLDLESAMALSATCKALQFVSETFDMFLVAHGFGVQSRWITYCAIFMDVPSLAATYLIQFKLGGNSFYSYVCDSDNALMYACAYKRARARGAALDESGAVLIYKYCPDGVTTAKKIMVKFDSLAYGHGTFCREYAGTREQVDKFLETVSHAPYRTYELLFTC